MKIYFCGSIRGGRDDAGLYRELIEILKKYGQVLTEHVGDPKLTVLGGDGGNEFIWKRDTDWLTESDLVIAECSTTSLGVGYELAFAEKLNKPVHVFYNTNRGSLSAMISGSPSFKIHYYSEKQELLNELVSVMDEEALKCQK